MNAVIIPAGGIGSRLGAEIPKQFLEIAGKPLIWHTISVFEALPEVDLIVIPVVKAWEENLKSLLVGFAKAIKIVPGGATRQDSVANGLLALPEETEIVLVHDACRPFVTQDLVRQVIAKIKAKGAALVALPSRDTVKEIENGLVLRTLPRERIYLAQTPQGARFALLKKAFLHAQEKGLLATDEAALLEACGIPVYVVCGNFLNFKITTREDLEIARAILSFSKELA